MTDDQIHRLMLSLHLAEDDHVEAIRALDAANVRVLAAQGRLNAAKEAIDTALRSAPTITAIGDANGAKLSSA